MINEEIDLMSSAIMQEDTVLLSYLFSKYRIENVT